MTISLIACLRCRSAEEPVLVFLKGQLCSFCYWELTGRKFTFPEERNYPLTFFDWFDIVQGRIPFLVSMKYEDDLEAAQLAELKRWRNINRVLLVYRDERPVEQLYFQGHTNLPNVPTTPRDRKRIKWQEERERIAATLRDDPHLSNHTVARKAEVHPATVAKTRHVLELRGEITMITKRMGKDGRVWAHK